MISGLQGKTYQEKLTELGLMSLEQRHTRFDMIMTFKIMYGFSRVSSSTWFQMAAVDAVRVTRLTADPWNLQYRPYNGDVRRHFFSNRVVEGWNNIPTSIKEARSIGVFKRKYDEMVLQQISGQHQ